MTKTILRYIVFALTALLSDLLAYALSPIAALPIFSKTDSDGRQTIRPVFRWITTHDAPIDIYAFGTEGRTHWLLKRFNVENPEANPAWLKYANRLLWIWRNPAYQTSHWLGYDQARVLVTKVRDESATWDTGYPSTTYWTAINAQGQRAFLYERQIYWLGQRCLEMQFGWKLYRDDPDGRCMLALRFHPFKKYEKAHPPT